MMITYTLAALCALGAEKFCANEIRKMNYSRNKREGGEPSSRKDEISPLCTILITGWGRVIFQTNIEGVYRALYALRTADRLLLLCARAITPDFDALFEMVRGAEVEHLLPKGVPITIGKVRTNRSTLAAQTSIQAVTHKALAERLCAAWGLRRLPEPAGPSFTPQSENADAPAAGNLDAFSAHYGDAFEFRVYVEKNKAELWLDISGAPLFKRGYRKNAPRPRESAVYAPGQNTGFMAAPLRETTAAALLLASGWRRRNPLYDPFCGSGTIAIEAAYFALDLAPNLRRGFALDRLLIADAAVAQAAREDLLACAVLGAEFWIRGSDSNNAVIAQARNNLEHAFDGLPLPEAKANRPIFNTLPMEDAKSYLDTPGFIITNPPWGRRQGDTGMAESTYTQMAVLRKNFPEWKIVVITDHSGFETFFGKRADSCSKITCGHIPTFVYQFENSASKPNQGTPPGGASEQRWMPPKPAPRGTAPRETAPKGAAPWQRETPPDAPRDTAPQLPAPQPENRDRVLKKDYVW